MTQQISDQNFQNEVLESKIPALVDFWAPWCGPCRQISPIIDELSSEFVGKVAFFKCNVDENPETPSKFMIRSIPTIMIFKNGKLVDSKIGSVSKAALTEWIKSTCGIS